MENTKLNLGIFCKEEYQTPVISLIEIKENLLSASGEITEDPFAPDIDWD